MQDADGYVREVAAARSHDHPKPHVVVRHLRLQGLEIPFAHAAGIRHMPGGMDFYSLTQRQAESLGLRNMALEFAESIFSLTFLRSVLSYI